MEYVVRYNGKLILLLDILYRNKMPAEGDGALPDGPSLPEGMHSHNINGKKSALLSASLANTHTQHFFRDSPLFLLMASVYLSSTCVAGPCTCPTVPMPATRVFETPPPVLWVVVALHPLLISTFVLFSPSLHSLPTRFACQDRGGSTLNIFQSSNR